MNRIIIYEPMTALTDLFIALLGVYFARELHEWYGVRFMNTHWHWSYGFVLLALGGLLGAISHGFGPHFPVIVRVAVWKMTLFSIGFAGFFLVMATLYHLFPFHTVQWLRWIPVILLTGYLFVVSRDDRFINAVIFYVPAMLFILLAMLYSKYSLNNPGAGWIAVGIIISFVAAGIQVSGFDLHRHFNHNDLYHVVQMAGMYYIYRGALLINDFGVVS